MTKLTIQSELKPAPTALPDDLKGAVEHNEVCTKFRELYAGAKGKAARDAVAAALAEKVFEHVVVAL